MVADEGEPAYSKWLVLLSFVAIFLITAVTATSLFAETQALARWGLRTFGSMLITWGVSQACAFFYDTDASNAELLQRIFLVSECALAIPSSSASSILRRQFVAIGPIVHIVLGRAARGVIVSLPAGYLVDGYGLQVRPASTRAIRLDVPYRMMPFAASCVVWLHPTIAWSVGAVVAPTHRPPPCTHRALCAMPSRRTCHQPCRVAPLTLAKQPEHAVGTQSIAQAR